jgi:hypothetical protein
VFDFVEAIFKMAKVFGAPSFKKILEVAHFGGLVDMQKRRPRSLNRTVCPLGLGRGRSREQTQPSNNQTVLSTHVGQHPVLGPKLRLGPDLG